VTAAVLRKRSSAKVRTIQPVRSTGLAQTPTEVSFRFDGMHRLIPSRYSEPSAFRGEATVLSAIADDEAMLDDITLLDGASNDRIRAERRGALGISTYELVYGIPNAHIVNAAYCYTSDEGARFSDHSRGAWYAADELDTALAEVTYHRARHLAEIIVPGLPGERPDADTSTYDDWLADFRTTFHELAPAGDYAEYLQPEPVPQCYLPGQRLAQRLLDAGANGILYPSVRRVDHLCVACFRPALVYNPRREARLAIRLENAGSEYAIHVSRVA
jgi:hypothetical protein